MIATKRAYEPYAPSDGYRVLIDRLWPRGLSKANAHLDAWAKEIAPSRELREWYEHDPAKWPEFRERYAKELKAPAAHAADISDVAVLSQLLGRRLNAPKAKRPAARVRRAPGAKRPGRSKN